MSPSDAMEQLVHDLLDRYKADVLPSRLLSLELRRNGHDVLIIKEMGEHGDPSWRASLRLV